MPHQVSTLLSVTITHLVVAWVRCKQGLGNLHPALVPVVDVGDEQIPQAKCLQCSTDQCMHDGCIGRGVEVVMKGCWGETMAKLRQLGTTSNQWHTWALAASVAFGPAFVGNM